MQIIHVQNNTFSAFKLNCFILLQRVCFQELLEVKMKIKQSIII